MNKTQMPAAALALPGRSTAMPVINKHFVTGNVIKPPFPENQEKILFGMGCFWGAERHYWQINGVFSTAAGYAGGFTSNPTYEEVCTGLTGHNEVVLVIFNPQVVSIAQILAYFWEFHNPTQGMRQGNDIGTQYRSGIYCYNTEQLSCALESKRHYQNRLNESGYPPITTEILHAPVFYYAEQYHQQYLAKNPTGYCGLGGTGIAYLVN